MPRVLLTTRSLPFPPTSGDRQRTNLICRALGDHAELDLLLVRDPSTVSDSVRSQVQQAASRVTWVAVTDRGDHWPWKAVRWLEPALVDRMAHNLGRRLVDYRQDPRVHDAIMSMHRDRRYDVLVGRYLEPIAKTGALESNSRVVVDVDDLDTEVYRTWLQTPLVPPWKRILIWNHLRQLTRFVPRLLAKADALWLSNPQDLTLVAHPKKTVLPNIPFPSEAVEAEIDDHRSEPCVAFVGSLTHRPNRDGLMAFVRSTWPLVIRRCPDARLRIYGSGLGDDLKRRLSVEPSVETVGFVEDIRDAYHKCLFTVVPLFEGGGTKIKVLESLALGRTLVATPHAQRGYEDVLRHEESLLIAKTHEAFAEECIRLLENRRLRRSLTDTGRRAVERHFSYERFSSIVGQTLTALD